MAKKKKHYASYDEAVKRGKANKEAFELAKQKAKEDRIKEAEKDSKKKD
jgi:hypothetical protein